MKYVKALVLDEGKKFKPGDMWSDDFDYDGMLKTALKVNEKTPLKTLQKLHDSATDVNYHTAFANLGNAIDWITDDGVKSPQGKDFIKQFHKDIKAEIKSNNESSVNEGRHPFPSPGIECPKCKGEGCDHCDHKGFHPDPLHEGPNYDDANFNLDKIFGDDQESIEIFQDIEDNGTVKDMIHYIDEFGDEDMLVRYGIRSTAHVKKLAQKIMNEANSGGFEELQEPPKGANYRGLARPPKRFTVNQKFTYDGTKYNLGDYALKKKRPGGGIYLNMDNSEMLGIDSNTLAKMQLADYGYYESIRTKFTHIDSLNESLAKNVLKDAKDYLTKTFNKLNKSYVKDYLKTIEQMARKNPSQFVKDYGDFAASDWIEDVEYNMANESVNEAAYKMPIIKATTMKEVEKVYPKAKKTSEVHGAVFYIELEKDLYAKAFSENTMRDVEPFTIEAIYTMKGKKQKFLWTEGKVNEGSVDKFLDRGDDNNIDFYNAVENLKAGELNKKNVLKLAKKYNIDKKEALKFVKDMWATMLEGKLNEANDIGKHPIPVREFTKYMKEFAKEIMQAGKHGDFTSHKDWEVAKKVAQYLKTARTPKTVDEYIKWHNGARAITGGKSFGMGSGFSDASSLISSIATEDPKITSDMVDKYDVTILPYIDKKVNESHEYHPAELENARMMRSSAAEFTKYLTRKAEESKPQNFTEVTEAAKPKKVNNQMWDKMDDGERENALLSIIKDPDDTEKWLGVNWKDLEGWMQRDMLIWESKVTQRDVSTAFDTAAKISMEMLANLEKYKIAKGKGDDKGIAKHKAIAAQLSQKKRDAEAKMNDLIQQLDADVSLEIIED